MSSPKAINNISGWIIIDKPSDITSGKVVSKIKHLIKPKKVGHAGTLDPLATGVLPIALGEATKTCGYAIGLEKEYLFTIKFGEETDTLDRDGIVVRSSENVPVENELSEALKNFSGEISQIPPAFSAIKKDGVRAYKKARKGEEVELDPRNVRIDSLDLLEQVSKKEFCLKVACSKGTYVRSLARDIAYKLGAYGHITALRRTKVGNFSEKNAISLAKLEELVHNGALFEELLPIDSPLDDIPVVELDKESSQKLRHGQTVKIGHAKYKKARAKYNNKLIAIGTVNENCFKPERVFNF